jgi:hypothetical protein
LSEKDFDRQGFREWTRQMFGARAEEVERLVDRMLRSRKRIRRKCAKCGFQGEHEVHDDKTALECLRWITESGFGRPGTSEEKSGGGDEFIFVNRIFTVDADGEETLSWLAERGLLAKPLADVEAAWTVEHTTPPEAAARLREIESAND